MVNPIIPPVQPPLRASSVALGKQPSDSLLKRAWNNHVDRRVEMLHLERRSCISEPDYRMRMATLSRLAEPNWNLTRHILSKALQEGGSSGMLDWRDNFSQLSIVLNRASVPETIPGHDGRTLIQRPENSGAILADDALVLAQLDVSHSYGSPAQIFWVQWKDAMGNDAGYRLTVETVDVDDESASDQEDGRIGIEQMDLRGQN